MASNIPKKHSNAFREPLMQVNGEAERFEEKILPEIRMWQAVLERAVEDLYITNFPFMVYRRDAQLYLRKDSFAFGQFRWLCEVLKIDHSWVRETWNHEIYDDSWVEGWKARQAELEAEEVRRYGAAMASGSIESLVAQLYPDTQYDVMV